MRGVVLSNCKEELDEIFGETNTQRNDELLRYEYFFFIYFLKKTNTFYCFSDDDDNDEFTLAWKKQKNSLEHAYVVTAWALSLIPDIIGADCMEHLNTNNRALRKLIDEVVSWLHYPHVSIRNW